MNHKTAFKLLKNHGGFWLLVALLALAGCATKPVAKNARPFAFGRDTFAYANQLTWEYAFDDAGKWKGTPREPKPDYTLHCFVVARSAKQFFLNARFDPSLPKTSEAEYKKLIREVVTSSPRRALPDSEKIVIPGFFNLRDFSEANENLMKSECGGAWQSYFQRGHWRMLFPFSRRHQARTAADFEEKLTNNNALVAHLVSFPDLKINHAVLLYDFHETEKEIEFAVYDPNSPEAPTKLSFNRAERTFYFPANHYFPGGKLDAYEVFRSALY